jgi:hypothetical protein
MEGVSRRSPFILSLIKCLKRLSSSSTITTSGFTVLIVFSTSAYNTFRVTTLRRKSIKKKWNAPCYTRCDDGHRLRKSYFHSRAPANIVVRRKLDLSSNLTTDWPKRTMWLIWLDARPSEEAENMRAPGRTKRRIRSCIIAPERIF